MINLTELMSQSVKLGDKTFEWIKTELEKRNITSLNIGAYVYEGYITNFTFYNCDKDGYGVALSVNSLYVENDIINLKMYDTCADEYFATYEIGDLNTTERLYLAGMLEEIFVGVDNEEFPLLKEDEDFLDYED